MSGTTHQILTIQAASWRPMSLALPTTKWRKLSTEHGRPWPSRQRTLHPQSHHATSVIETCSSGPHIIACWHEVDVLTAASTKLAANLVAKQIGAECPADDRIGCL